jgi:Ca2+-transporting ATPase
MSVRSDHRLVTGRYIFLNRPLWGAVALTVLLQMAIIYLPFLHPIFKTTALDMEIMAMLTGITVLNLVCFELVKVVVWKRFKTR